MNYEIDGENKTMNENYNQKNLMKLDLQNITNYDAFIDYLGKIIKDQPQISPYYIIQILEFDISKYQKINTKQEMTIANYFKKILNIYKNEICPRDLVSLCIYVNNVNVVEDIIRKNYKNLRQEIRKIIFLSNDEFIKYINTTKSLDYKMSIKDKKYNLNIFGIDLRNASTLYKYFENDIKLFIDNKLIKIKNNNFTESYYILNSLKGQNYNNFNVIQNMFLKKYFNIEFSEEKLENKAVLEFVEKIYRRDKIQIKNLDSIYSFEFMNTMQILSKKVYNDNKYNCLFLSCFKLFLKEFTSNYEDQITFQDINYLEILFKRAIKRNNVFELLKLKNRQSLIHYYKSNEYIDELDIPIEYIKNYNVNQYRQIVNLCNEYYINTSDISKKNIISFADYYINTSDTLKQSVIILLNILDYDVILKLIEFGLNEIAFHLKDKSIEYIEEFQYLIRSIKSEDKFDNVSLMNYITVFDKLIKLKNKKITMITLKKFTKSIYYINKLCSFYNIFYTNAIKKLSKSSNKNDDLYLACFKLFLKEFINNYKDNFTIEEFNCVEKLFRRAIKENCVNKLVLLNNKKSLINCYKSNEYINILDVPIEYVENYNVKQYRQVINLCNSFSATLKQSVIMLLNILDYDVILKLIKFDLNEVALNLKDRSPEYIEKFQYLIRSSNIEELDTKYSISNYMLALDKLIKLKNKNITITNLKKIMESIDIFLIPSNVHIKENLEQLDKIVKGEPFIEKLEGIKLYNEYRKRLTSSIPNCDGKYNKIKYGLVDLHDKKIISNGVGNGNYLLPQNIKSSSCLTPNGKAKSCLEHGALNPNGRFFQIINNDQIVAYSWVWRCGDVLCFDNIEITDEIENIKDYEKAIYEIYLQAAKQIVEKTKQEQEKGIKIVLIGRNEKDIKNKYIDNLQSLNNLNKKLFKPNSEKELYLKDSSEKQVILYGDYNENLDTVDVEPIYLYERKKVQRFSDLSNKEIEVKINSIYYDYCLQNNMKYKKIKNNYVSGYVGEDWFIGNKNNGTYDFYYDNNDKRLFYEVKKHISLEKQIELKNINIYIPKFNVDYILNQKNIVVDEEVINDYLKQLNSNDYIIPENYFSHTTSSIENLNKIFHDEAITSAFYGKRLSYGMANGKYYISVAQINSPAYQQYKKTGTIILDDNMQVNHQIKLEFNNPFDKSLFSDTSYPIRTSGIEGECHIFEKISRDHFKCLLTCSNDNIKLAQIIFLNEAYNLDLPIVLEETKSKIDTDFVKKHIKIKH